MNDIIQIKEIKEPVCKLFNPKSELIGIITSELQLMDVRVQIKKLKLNGYFIHWENEIIMIDSDGRLDTWPEGFYDLSNNLLMELL